MLGWQDRVNGVHTEMEIFEENGHGDPSSKPRRGYLYFPYS